MSEARKLKIKIMSMHFSGCSTLAIAVAVNLEESLVRKIIKANLENLRS